MNSLLPFAVILIAGGIACSDLSNDSPKKDAKQDAPCSARYVPVGNNPDVALDTQTGSLCRTVPEIAGSSSGATTQNPDKYASLPACDTHQSAHSFQSFSDWKKSQDAKK